MLDRREALNRMALGGVASALAPLPRGADSAAAGPPPDDAAGDAAVARAVQAVRDEIARQGSFWELTPVRDQVRTFLRSNGKFPDFIEVGSDVWQQVYDWHVRFRQDITLGRTSDARYTIKLMETNLIMRSDLTPGYIGLPFDNR